MGRQRPEDGDGSSPYPALDIAESNALSARITTVANHLSDHILQYGISAEDAAGIDALIGLMETLQIALQQSAERHAED